MSTPENVNPVPETPGEAAPREAKAPRKVPPKVPLHKNPFFWGFVVGIVFVTLMRPLTRHIPEPPPVIAPVPTFSLTNQNGEKFGSDDLRGDIYVANFIFTRCKGVCPELSRGMAELQERYAREERPMKLVSFSVDPTYDSPEKLAEYAKRYNADPARWNFLTGDEATVRELLVKGFGQYLGEKTVNTDNLVDIAHSERFVLVDYDGNIRGHYSSDADGLDEVFHRSLHVQREQKIKARHQG
ncbi:MAG: SCO family protein [Deltaproteobacteria bacterium]|nr:SCO family protein [Deltaproteobacteria bacterium]MCB9478443.1 SCO family protein [Deltaproteobacteria bacterium]MCB9489942.1 SCO family protein [Deltaproteobacteria bacterium]